jgi:hypothetical protein
MPSDWIEVRPFRRLWIQKKPFVVPQDEERHKAKDREQNVLRPEAATHALTRLSFCVCKSTIWKFDTAMSLSAQRPRFSRGGLRSHRPPTAANAG